MLKDAKILLMDQEVVDARLSHHPAIHFLVFGLPRHPVTKADPRSYVTSDIIGGDSKMRGLEPLHPIHMTNYSPLRQPYSA